eukprot:CAMPEP_0185754446 /NCGR_PEP_ID=MMETSP1174-20130828/13094_1 /TAXON_ID=35687 /ORGANISM="Dictyocha speculum, Strain CCMP1381" /LENGTH=119 /DNA_ID=CAMNT_0028432651 /DNA_START=61 /DNA_END=420 /DNA_ORIENTATION=-
MAIKTRMRSKDQRAPRLIRPPSTGSKAPVMKDASSEARKDIASATSSGLATRPSDAARGWVVPTDRSMKAAYASSVIPPAFCRLVLVTPGFTPFTRIPKGAKSTDAHRVIMSMAALALQ